MTSGQRVRTIIVDDEPLAREHLAALLADEPDIEIIGEAGGGSAAIQLIGSTKPDLVFLDVQMPGCDGFEVLTRVAPVHLPAVVFVTAYDRHAIRAFEVAAVDYVLKPPVEPRLRAAVRRAVERVRGAGAGDVSGQLSQISRLLRHTLPDATDRIPISADGRVTFVRTLDIDWIDASDDEVRLHVGSTVHALRETMTAMERRLPGDFMRIHRSIIVNVNRVRAIEPWFKGDYVLVMTSGAKLTTGRTYRERVRTLLK
jgi:two-component system LytT family response regulator